MHAHRIHGGRGQCMALGLSRYFLFLSGILSEQGCHEGFPRGIVLKMMPVHTLQDRCRLGRQVYTIRISTAIKPHQSPPHGLTLSWSVFKQSKRHS